MKREMEITALLQRVSAGEHRALNEVIPLVYDELKRLASARLRRDGKVDPLETTALVHEAYLRLVGARHPQYENRSHFYGIASRLMRQILVDAARARCAGKRAAAAEVTLHDVPDQLARPDETLLAMNEALERLERADPLKAQLIEMRYFGGMTAEESAEALSISVDRARREARVGQAWLRREMSGEDPHGRYWERA